MQSLLMQQLIRTSCDTTAEIIVCNIKTVFRQYYRNYRPSASTPVWYELVCQHYKNLIRDSTGFNYPYKMPVERSQSICKSNISVYVIAKCMYHHHCALALSRWTGALFASQLPVKRLYTHVTGYLSVAVATTVLEPRQHQHCNINCCIIANALTLQQSILQLLLQK